MLAQPVTETYCLRYSSRPNPETHPVLAAKWSRLAAQRFEFIQPELQTAPFERHMNLALIERRRLLQEELARYDAKELVRDRGQLLFDLTKFPDSTLADISNVRIDLSALLALLPETSKNWSGYVKRPVAEPIVTVTGQWNVPGVNPPWSARTASGTLRPRASGMSAIDRMASTSRVRACTPMPQVNAARSRARSSTVTATPASRSSAASHSPVGPLPR